MKKLLIFALSFASWWFTACSENQVCGFPPVVEHAKPSIQKDENAVGSEISYNCKLGYVSDGVLGTSRCELIESEQRAVWTDVKLVCVQRPCSDPGFVDNAHRTGHIFAFSHNVHYGCEEGYRMVGQDTRYCQANGEWSGKAPACEKIYCNRPENPEHGKIVYKTLEYGTELSYQCDDGYTSSNKEPRICQADGTWSGEPHTCNEGKCNFPKAPNHGSVELLGKEANIGSIAIYSCKAGYFLIGSEKSKCLDTGEWNFEAPVCLEPCNVPNVPHGKIGRYVRVLRKTYLQFNEIHVRTPLKDGEKLFLICESGYEPLGSTDWQRVVVCNAGKWLQTPRCEPAACRITPPGSHDTTTVSINRTHGGRVDYACKEDFELSETGSVVCHLGNWKGKVPVCKDTRCYPEVLSFVGLVKETRVFFRSGESFVPRCSKGFDRAKVENNLLTCKNGKWHGHMPPCVAASCLSPPPLPPHGYIPILRDSYLHSSTPVYQCDKFYFENIPSTMQCLNGDWVGKLPICSDSRCYVQNLKVKTGVGILNSSSTFSRERLTVRCLEGYSVIKNPPVCLNGKWQGDEVSPCYENPCDIFRIDNGALTLKKITAVRVWLRWEERVDFQKIAIGTVPPKNQAVFLTCDHGYTMHGKGRNNVHLMCSKGYWIPQPICLSDGTTFDQSFEIFPGIPASSTNIVISTPNSEVDDTRRETAIGRSSNKDNCYCTYPLNDDNVIAQAEDQPLQFQSLVKKGTTVYFRCRNFGYSRLMGVTEFTCDNCSWHSSEVPSCVDPMTGDAIISFSGKVDITPKGMLTVQKGEMVTLTCSSVDVDSYPKWTVPFNAQVQISQTNDAQGKRVIYSSVLEIMNASLQHEGTYACAVGTFRPNVITLDVTEFECENMEEDEYLRIYYTSGLVVGSTATFHCVTPGTRVGTPKAICLPDGRWSGRKPFCKLPACNLEDLEQALPQYSFLELGELRNETIPFGSSLQISCEDGYVLNGYAEAKCGKNKAWELDEIQCRQGCAPIKRASNSSELIVDPEKDSYYVGDHVIFFCPDGLELNSDIEVMMCLNSGWSGNEVPECDAMD